MTRLGDVNRFGVDIELDDLPCEEWLFGRIRFWVEGEPIGDWDEVSSLRDVMNLLSRIHGHAGRRQSSRFLQMHAVPALETIYANEAQWPRHKVLPEISAFEGVRAVLIEDDVVARLIVQRREHFLEVGEVDRVFGQVIAEIEALHAQALARKSGLRVDVRTVRVRSEGLATGDIAITLNGQQFPAEGWNDFVVPVYAAWTGALARLLRGSTTSERVVFMDGPYELLLTRVDDETICVNGVEEFPAQKLAENAVLFAHQLHEVCQAQRYQLAYSPGDVFALESSLRLLSSVIRDAP